MTAKQSVHVASDEHIALTAQKQVIVTSEDRFVMSVVNGIRAFSQKAGVKVYAGKDDIELQAQDGRLEAIARHDVQVISTEGGVEIISPNVVSIKVCGTELKMTPEGVFITTPGIFKVKASEHVFEDKGKVNFKLPNLPNTKLPFSNKFDVYDLFYKYAFDEIEYIAETASGQLIEGTLDEHGRTGTIMSSKQESFDIAIGFKDAGWGFEFEPDEDQEISDKEMNGWTAESATEEALDENGLWAGPIDTIKDWLTSDQGSNAVDRTTDAVITTLLKEYTNAPSGMLAALQGALTGGQATVSTIKAIFQRDYNYYRATGERLQYQELSSMPNIQRCLSKMDWDKYATFDQAWSDVGRVCSPN